MNFMFDKLYLPQNLMKAKMIYVFVENILKIVLTKSFLFNSWINLIPFKCPTV